MTDEEAALAILGPCRSGGPSDRLIDNLEWHLLERNVKLGLWSHSQAALLRIARAVWLHKSLDYGDFGVLDRQNRALVLATMMRHLDVQPETLDLVLP